MTYLPLLPAYKHQTAALEKMRGKRAFALLKAPRTGKSKTLLDDFGEMELNKEVHDLFVEAPGGAYRTWETAFKEHASEDLQSRAMVHTWQSENNNLREKRKLEAFLSKADVSCPRILLMNCEALSRPGVARDVAQEFLRQRHNVMAIDESVLNKNHAAKRTKFNNKMLAPKATYRRILSGLATPRSPLDLYSQFEFLDWNILGFRSYWAFRNRYAVMSQAWFCGRTVQIVNGYQHEDELQALIEPHSYRCEFRPKIPSTYSIREVALTPEQEKAYKELKEFATTQLACLAHVTATVVIAQILRLHQILCGHVKDEQGNIHQIPENKITALLKLLDDYDGKAIVWCSYDEDVRKVAAALIHEFGEGCTARFWGGNLATREIEEARFKTDPQCRFMVATPAAGRYGRTWDGADLVVFYSSTNDLDHRDQAEQRPLGIQKDRGVDYVDLIAPGTVETKILEALRKKIDMASIINGDSYREWLI